MHKTMYNLQKITTTTHIIPEFPGNPKGQECKIPIVRSPKPSLFAVELAPQYHQLTLSKTKMPKGIAGKNAQNNVQPTNKDNQNSYNIISYQNFQGILGAKNVRSL